MSMRDQIADIINEELIYDDDGSVSCFMDSADAILTALPDMIAPLVWIEKPDGSMKSKVDGRTYHIYYALGVYHAYIGQRSHSRVEFKKLTQAQAAANTHHRAAIMAAFTGETQ